jgi:hypothetical protein
VKEGKTDIFHISFSMAMAARQISITLDEELLEFLDRSGSNRSAAVAEAVSQWRDLQWQRHLVEAYAALNEADADQVQTIGPPDALVAAREAAALSPSPS